MDVRQPAAPTFVPNENVDTIEAQVRRLDLGPDSVIVIKSNNIDMESVRALRKQFNRQVIGLAPDDEVETLNVKAEDTIVIRGPSVLESSPEVLAEIEKTVKLKLGCKAVLFLAPETTIEKMADDVAYPIVKQSE